MTTTTTDDVTHLRALLAEQTARADHEHAEMQKQAELAVDWMIDAQRALAACAEMRAAARVAHEHACKMAEFHGQRCEEHDRHDEAPDDCLRCAADTAFGIAFADLRAVLSRPDLGAGVVVVPREVVERVHAAWAADRALADLLSDDLRIYHQQADVLANHDAWRVKRRDVVADLDALLGKEKS